MVVVVKWAQRAQVLVVVHGDGVRPFATTVLRAARRWIQINPWSSDGWATQAVVMGDSGGDSAAMAATYQWMCASGPSSAFRLQASARPPPPSILRRGAPFSFRSSPAAVLPHRVAQVRVRFARRLHAVARPVHKRSQPHDAVALVQLGKPPTPSVPPPDQP